MCGIVIEVGVLQVSVTFLPVHWKPIEYITVLDSPAVTLDV